MSAAQFFQQINSLYFLTLILFLELFLALSSHMMHFIFPTNQGIICVHLTEMFVMASASKSDGVQNYRPHPGQ